MPNWKKLITSGSDASLTSLSIVKGFNNLIISGSSSDGDPRNSQILTQRSLEFRSIGGSTDNLLKLEHNGNVGIGVAAPNFNLDVSSSLGIAGEVAMGVSTGYLDIV